jgi:RNA-binding protein YlmH
MEKNVSAGRFGTDPAQKALFAHLLDLAKRSEDRRILTASGFLSEADAAAAKTVLQAAGCRRFFFFGGYGGAERTCAVFLPDYLEEDDVREAPALAGITFLTASVDRFYQTEASIGHRDCLGALMALGIERDCVGDLIAEGGEAILIVRTTVADYLAEALKQIGRWPVAVTRRETCEVKSRDDGEPGSDTVASMRLDAVTAAVFRLSRGAAAEAVAGGSVAVNGLTAIRGDAAVREGDKISLRGQGRVIIDGIDGVSRKGRIRFRFRRYR